MSAREAFRRHRHATVDEARHHQPVAGIEEQHLGIDARGRGRPGRHFLVGAVDVLARACAGDAKHVLADPVVEVGQPGQPLGACAAERSHGTRVEDRFEVPSRPQPRALRVVQRAVVAGGRDRFAVDLDHAVGAVEVLDRQVAVRDRLADRVTEVGAGREADDVAVER